ncbi:MAG: tryptophanyl-tRNA synthetase [Moorella sp. (in: firmicutes)]|nr:tryptophanyl-tRNA synthetase [Moorella sp. (in: firmicutes)]
MAAIEAKKKGRILTGDRPTGKLHLGHYVGSLINRVRLQDEYDTFLIIADVQALTTNFEEPEKLAADVREVALDYLAAGIDPEKSTIFVQSLIPEIAELTVFFSMIVTVNTLRHNPTIKSEAAQRGYTDMTYGFLGYPVSQTADITFCKANLVPVGEDQLPHIELARKIVRRFNSLYGPVLVEPEALIGEVPRLVGLDGAAKMSKSLDNAIHLADPPEEVERRVKNAVTDPARIRATDPGHPDICTVFAYHGAFNKPVTPEIEESCKKGAIGCVACKKRLTATLNALLEPMRARRARYEANPKLVEEILMAGTERARVVARETMAQVREAMKISYFPGR